MEKLRKRGGQAHWITGGTMYRAVAGGGGEKGWVKLLRIALHTLNLYLQKTLGELHI